MVKNDENQFKKDQGFPILKYFGNENAGLGDDFGSTSEEDE